VAVDLVIDEGRNIDHYTHDRLRYPIRHDLHGLLPLMTF